jgi:hypothetical protein
VTSRGEVAPLADGVVDRLDEVIAMIVRIGR